MNATTQYTTAQQKSELLIKNATLLKEKAAKGIRPFILAVPAEHYNKFSDYEYGQHVLTFQQFVDSTTLTPEDNVFVICKAKEGLTPEKAEVSARLLDEEGIPIIALYINIGLYLYVPSSSNTKPNEWYALRNMVGKRGIYIGNNEIATKVVNDKPIANEQLAESLAQAKEDFEHKCEQQHEVP